MAGVPVWLGIPCGTVGVGRPVIAWGTVVPGRLAIPCGGNGTDVVGMDTVGSVCVGGAGDFFDPNRRLSRPRFFGGSVGGVWAGAGCATGAGVLRPPNNRRSLDGSGIGAGGLPSSGSLVRGLARGGVGSTPLVGSRSPPSVALGGAAGRLLGSTPWVGGRSQLSVALGGVAGRVPGIGSTRVNVSPLAGSFTTVSTVPSGLRDARTTLNFFSG